MSPGAHPLRASATAAAPRTSPLLAERYDWKIGSPLAAADPKLERVSSVNARWKSKMKGSFGGEDAVSHGMAVIDPIVKDYTV